MTFDKPTAADLVGLEYLEEGSDLVFDQRDL